MNTTTTIVVNTETTTPPTTTPTLANSKETAVKINCPSNSTSRCVSCLTYSADPIYNRVVAALGGPKCKTIPFTGPESFKGSYSWAGLDSLDRRQLFELHDVAAALYNHMCTKSSIIQSLIDENAIVEPDKTMSNAAPSRNRSRPAIPHAVDIIHTMERALVQVLLLGYSFEEKANMKELRKRLVRSFDRHWRIEEFRIRKSMEREKDQVVGVTKPIDSVPTKLAITHSKIKRQVDLSFWYKISAMLSGLWKSEGPGGVLRK